MAEHLREPDRFESFSAKTGDLLLDFSRTGMDQQVLKQLLAMAEDRGLKHARNRLFAGENVNFTENRPAMHMAMRSDDVLAGLGTKTATLVSDTRQRMLEFASAFAAGHLPGQPGQAVRHIIHIGIGGSVLGPRLLIEALGEGDSPQVHFLSSVDAHLRTSLLASLDPAGTAVIVATKSFTTGETLLHARRVMDWMEQALGREVAQQRLFAVSGNQEAVDAFGALRENTLYLPDWVGGRYSIWSAVSLASAAVMGADGFSELLRGAAEMDRHFQTAPLAENLPVLMALTDIWHRNVCKYPAQVVIPYDYRLRSLPAYLQQLVMESNGKSVDSQGRRIEYSTSPVLFGEPGTDAQHSLFQMFHQGTDIVPLSFIGVIRPDHGDKEAHAALLANMLAQATALATGTAGLGDQETTDVHRQMQGQRPSVIVLLDSLTPFALGQLLALYEHKVFVEGVIWDINSYDQFGVELGKVVAKAIQPALESDSTGVAENFGLDGILDYIRSKD
ncbi:MAG: glucose-6-phosphate isomerase [Xanthomonadales bacterium]|nr:glucose-6-phosphate isomerase [Xanthomonadales bacterium]